MQKVVRGLVCWETILSGNLCKLLNVIQRLSGVMIYQWGGSYNVHVLVLIILMHWIKLSSGFRPILCFLNSVSNHIGSLHSILPKRDLRPRYNPRFRSSSLKFAALLRT